MSEYARDDDPDTSQAAAESLDLTLSESLTKTLGRLHDLGMFTDKQGGDWLAKNGWAVDSEAGRRSIRTLRKPHGRIIPVRDWNTNEQRTKTNKSGRKALLWMAS